MSPKTLDPAELQIAAETLPLAIAVKAIDEETADGRTAR